MEFKNYYDVLGLGRDAKADEIKKANRKLARKYHPDVSKESNANQRMQDINEAYTVLSDEEKRASYDEISAPQRDAKPHQRPRDWQERQGGLGPDASDFFHNVFGHASKARQSSNFHMRGEDLHAAIDIALTDSCHGAVREVSIRSPALDEHGVMHTHQHLLNVHVPKGIRAGQHICMKGQGGPGFGGASAGDLYPEVRIRACCGVRASPLVTSIQRRRSRCEGTRGGRTASDALSARRVRGDRVSRLYSSDSTRITKRGSRPGSSVLSVSF